MRRSAPAAGFTLIELLAAIAIFGLMTVTVLVGLDRATDMALTSVRARELRVLAERKLGEVQVFEREFDDIFDNERFDDEYGEIWEGWEWSLFIRDVVIFGETNDEAAEYLFGAPDENDDDENTTDPDPQQQQGETQFLRELTLTVRAPTGDDVGGADDSVTIVTFLPLVDHGPASATGAPTGSGN